MEAIAMTAAGSVTSSAFEPYTNDVYGWAFRFLGHHHDALDVVQDVFLRWNKQCSLALPLQPRGWLRRVTLNRVIDVRRQQQPVVEIENGIELATKDDAPEARLDHETLRGDVTAALDQLTEMQRGVLVAKVYDEMTYSQIAHELGIGVSTAKTHYMRAIRATRDRLRPRWSKENKI
jgi:RNA polymerase sigma factor (sigma-70 family)